METKLTLRLNDSVIERAKIYAKNHKISLSKMIESYLDSVTKQKDEKKNSITPLVESLSGVIDLPVDYDYKKELCFIKTNGLNQDKINTQKTSADC